MSRSIYLVFLDEYYKSQEISKKETSLSNVGVPVNQTNYNKSKNYDIMIGDDILCKVYDNFLGENKVYFFGGGVVDNLKLWCSLNEEDAEKIVMEWAKDKIM
jgi:hypothetical protein